MAVTEYLIRQPTSTIHLSLVVKLNYLRILTQECSALQNRDFHLHISGDSFQRLPQPSNPKIKVPFPLKGKAPGISRKQSVHISFSYLSCRFISNILEGFT